MTECAAISISVTIERTRPTRKWCASEQPAAMTSEKPALARAARISGKSHFAEA
jgi:hypothetical protein